MHRSIHVHAWCICMRKRNARDHRPRQKRKRGREKERTIECAPWGMMAKLLRAVSQLGWPGVCRLGLCAAWLPGPDAIRHVRHFHWDSARGWYHIRPRCRGIPDAMPFEVYFAIVTRTPRVLTGCGLRPGARPRRYICLSSRYRESSPKTEGLMISGH